jgi:uncharacterized protein YndB with AHSA1/START domain
LKNDKPLGAGADRLRRQFFCLCHQHPDDAGKALVGADDTGIQQEILVRHDARVRMDAGLVLAACFKDGRIVDAGEVVEADPPRRLVLSWRNEFKPEMKAEGATRCTMTLEPTDDCVKQTLIHEIRREGSKFIEAVSGGWPLILSNLKSLLETGEVGMKKMRPTI